GQCSGRDPRRLGADRAARALPPLGRPRADGPVRPDLYRSRIAAPAPVRHCADSRHALPPHGAAAFVAAQGGIRTRSRRSGSQGMTVLLSASNIAKHFGGIRALKEVSLTINAGEIYGLIGPNGAGKTTFFNVITGLYQRDGGDIVFDGQPLRVDKPHEVTRAGIARTFQNIRLFAEMSALENVMVGRHLRSKGSVLGAVLRTPAVRAEEAAIRARAMELLAYVGIAAKAGVRAASLSYGDQRRLEIARALATEP